MSLLKRPFPVMHPSQIRRLMRAQRRELAPPAQSRHSQLLFRLARCHSPFIHARRVAFYLASRGEIDPSPLLQFALSTGKQVYLPVLRQRPSHGLWFSSYRKGDHLIANRFGIPEPVVHTRRLVMPWSIDVVFVPLVAFDDSGNRLGMGGGYYDRTFAFIRTSQHMRRPKLIGLAHDFQRVDPLERQDWDIPLDAVITERHVYSFHRALRR